LLKDYQEKILELFVQLELDMSGLYSLFAVKFPKYENLWATLSQQELDHAERVKKLWFLASKNKIVFEEKLTKTYTVKRVLDSVKDAYANAKADKMNLMTALSVSRDFEQSIIEKEFYNFFTGKDPETRALINSIKGETLVHQSMLKNAWEEERKITLS
jgi:hypothetical protein